MLTTPAARTGSGETVLLDGRTLDVTGVTLLADAGRGPVSSPPR